MAAHGAIQGARPSLTPPCALLLLFTVPSNAADFWGGSLSATTDYIYRGISQSNGEPAIQGGLYAQPSPGWTVGVWASTADLSGSGTRTAEIDVYVSRSWSLGTDWDARVGLTHYAYPNDPAWLRYDYDEVIASLTYRQRLTATATWSPSVSRYGGRHVAKDREASSYELTYLQPVIGTWSLGAGVGYYDLSDLFDTGYWYWNVGVVYSWERLQVDLTHIDTDDTAHKLFPYQAADRGWSAALTWRF